MRSDATRAAAPVIAFALAIAGAVPCACVEMTSPADTSPRHCGAAGFGLRAGADACSCACMTAQGDGSTTATVERVSSGTAWVAPEGSLVARSYHSASRLPRGRVGHSPPSFVPRVLRI